VYASPAVTHGSPQKLGAHWDGKGTNFALFSANGEKVELCLSDETGQHETARITLPARTGDIHHGYIEELQPGQLYGYRVHGPYEPHNGHRFNPHKLLLDPYAQEFGGAFKWDDSHYGYIVGHPDGDLSFDSRDNARYMIKAKVPLPDVPSNAAAPHTPWKDTIIYEAHVRGLTMDNPAVPEKIRGTFEGVADDAIINHLKELGVTAIELMPVQAFFNDRFQEEHGRRNYWGYNTLGFFAPEPRYGGMGQFRAMAEKFHKAGIEVLLDVVYNHTFEGNHLGPTLSFRGIDNASYYRLQHDKRYYIDETGCGNTVNTDHPGVRRMIVDSLRHWAQAVDGFRFDLMTTLGRRANGYDKGHPIFGAIRRDPVLSTKKMVAEPWDLGPGGYRLGEFPAEYHEWNDVFRDEVRGFWHGRENHIGKLAYALTGSRNHFNRKAPGVSASINAVAMHDGFPLNDVVSYNEKHNEANGEDNRDGNNNNVSYNHGVEGPAANPAIKNLRERQKRNMIATLFLAQGTPLLLAGDEFGNTQGGNNNAYCQDNKTGWTNFADMTPEGRALMEFTRKVIALRRQYPVLNPPAPLDGKTKDADGITDITWYIPAGEEKRIEHWNDPQARALGVLFNGAARNLGAPGNNRLFVIFNAHTQAVPFSLPKLPGIKGWERILDTVSPDAGHAAFYGERLYSAEGKSLAVFRPIIV